MKPARQRKFKDPPLQPLRIPTGWMVEWNTFFDVQPKFEPQEDQSWRFENDLLLMSNERAGFVIGLGWYPKLRRGMFRIAAVRCDRTEKLGVLAWDKPEKELVTRSKEKVVRTLERWMEGYGNQKISALRKSQPRGRSRRRD